MGRKWKNNLSLDQLDVATKNNSVNNFFTEPTITRIFVYDAVTGVQNPTLF